MSLDHHIYGYELLLPGSRFACPPRSEQFRGTQRHWELVDGALQRTLSNGPWLLCLFATLHLLYGPPVLGVVQAEGRQHLHGCYSLSGAQVTRASLRLVPIMAL